MASVDNSPSMSSAPCHSAASMVVAHSESSGVSGDDAPTVSHAQVNNNNNNSHINPNHPVSSAPVPPSPSSVAPPPGLPEPTSPQHQHYLRQMQINQMQFALQQQAHMQAQAQQHMYEAAAAAQAAAAAAAAAQAGVVPSPSAHASVHFGVASNRAQPAARKLNTPPNQHSPTRPFYNNAAPNNGPVPPMMPGNFNPYDMSYGPMYNGMFDASNFNPYLFQQQLSHLNMNAPAMYFNNAPLDMYGNPMAFYPNENAPLPDMSSPANYDNSPSRRARNNNNNNNKPRSQNNSFNNNNHVNNIHSHNEAHTAAGVISIKDDKIAEDQARANKYFAANGASSDQDKVGPATYKTEMCRSFQATNQCDYNSACQFAHSINELRSREVDSKYKTELCKNFISNNGCWYSSRCKYIHDEYRLQVKDYEFWLVSPSDNLVRIERVPSNNTARLEQLIELVKSEHNQRMTKAYAHLNIHSNATSLANIHVAFNPDSKGASPTDAAAANNNNNNNNNNTAPTISLPLPSPPISVSAAAAAAAALPLRVPPVPTQASSKTNPTVVTITPIIPLANLNAQTLQQVMRGQNFGAYNNNNNNKQHGKENQYAQHYNISSSSSSSSVHKSSSLASPSLSAAVAPTAAPSWSSKAIKDAEPDERKVDDDDDTTAPQQRTRSQSIVDVLVQQDAVPKITRSPEIKGLTKELANTQID